MVQEIVERNGRKLSRDTARLRIPQIRILKALAKYRVDGLTRSDIHKIAQVSMSMTQNLGPIDLQYLDDIVKRYKKPNLISLGMIDVERHMIEGKEMTVYFINAKGLRALEELGPEAVKAAFSSLDSTRQKRKSKEEIGE
jgi:hypothetical protein